MTSRLRIAFFGSSLVSSYWNGAATYYRGIIKALANKGNHITFYEPDAFERQQHRDIEDPPWAKVVVYEATEAAAAKALESTRGADIVIKASGVGVLDAWLEQAVLTLQNPSTLVLFWDVDAPATLERISAHPNDPFRRLIPRYDFILTYGGGTPVVNAYKALGAHACHPIYNALDPDTHYPVRPNSRFMASLSFLGNRLPDREARVEEFFFKVVSQLPHFRFVLGGNGWDDKVGAYDNLKYVNHVYTRDHNAFNCSANAVLNINRDSMARFGYSPTTRVFEAAGCAACLIMDDWEGIDLFLEPEKEVLLARNGDDVTEHLLSLTKYCAKRIGNAARRRILREHTYRHRADTVERLLRHALPAQKTA